MAKSGLLPAATLLFLLLLVYLSPTRTTADLDRDVVVDIEGNPLEVGSEYYIQPVDRTGLLRGGIRRSPKPGQSSCPLYAFESPIGGDRGQPVKFIPSDKTQTEIRLSSVVQIDSSLSVSCEDDGLWRVTIDAMTRQAMIMASGASHVPRSWFIINRDHPLLPPYRITVVPDPYGSSREGLFYQDVTLLGGSSSRMKFLGLTQNSVEALYVVFVQKRNPVDIITSLK